MSQDDGYEPVLDVGDGGSDDVGLPGDGAALEPREVVRERGVRDTTRKLFAEAASKLKPQLEAGDGFDELEPAINDDPPEAAAGATASSANASKADPKPAAVAPASDPVAVAVDTSKAAQVEMRERQLEEREKSLSAREESIAARETVRERFFERPGEVIRDMVKEWTGAASDAELQDEIADLITDLSSSVLGAQVPDQHRTAMEARRALKAVKAHKADYAKKETELAKKAEQQERARNEQNAMRTLSAEIDRAKDKFPNLALEDDPGAIVWEVVKTKFHQDGTEPSWEDCARLAEEHFKKKSDAWIAKRRHLLAPAAPQAPVAASAPQGDPQSRRSSTLTNKTAAPVPPAPSSDGEVMDKEAHRRRSLANLRGAMKESAT
jgi:hypothetical protein